MVHEPPPPFHAATQLAKQMQCSHGSIFHIRQAVKEKGQRMAEIGRFTG
jgi:hypothetical protein